MCAPLSLEKKLKYERRKLQESYKTGNEVNLIFTAACLLIASLRNVFYNNLSFNFLQQLHNFAIFTRLVNEGTI